MANILGLLTVNGKLIYEVDADPGAAAGTPAAPGSLAYFDDGAGVGQNYIKIGSADTAWDLVMTKTKSSVGLGNILTLPIYDTDPNGYHVGASAQQNSQSISVVVIPQASRSAGIVYTIPNPGNAVTAADFVLTEGAQTINGDKTFGNNVIITGNLTVNGSLTYIHTTNMQISDALITLNKAGAAGSGSAVGFEIEEDSAITGYLKTTTDRAGYIFRAPAGAQDWTLDFSNVATSAKTVKVPNSDGTMVLRPNATTQVAGQVTFWSDANNVTSVANLFWDSANSRLSIASGNTPSDTLDLTGTFRMRDMTLGSVIYAGANGVLSQDNSNFFWDGSNHRLGLGTTTPSRLLDVKGTSLFQSAIRQADQTATKANWEQLQAGVQTTTAAVTPIATIAIAADSEALITARIMGRKGATGDSVAYVRTVKAKNVGGTVTIRSAQSDYTAEDPAINGCHAALEVSTTNIAINVTGIAATTIDWTVTYTVQTLS